jgi:hypothetical protein
MMESGWHITGTKFCIDDGEILRVVPNFALSKSKSYIQVSMLAF